MTVFKFANVAPLELRRAGRAPNAVEHHVLFLEPGLHHELFTRPEWARCLSSGWMRIEGEIRDRLVSLVWQPSVLRGHFARLCPQLCASLGLTVGEWVTLRFNPLEPTAPAAKGPTRRK